MDRGTAVGRFRCQRGTTLLEVVVCLAVLGLFVTGFVQHLAGAEASSAALAERTKAEGALRTVRALLSAEDPWTAPEVRTFSVGAGGAPAEAGADTYDVRVAGTTLCAGGAMPLDNAGSPPPGGCPGSQRAVRRWHVSVSYATRYGDSQRDSVTSDVDVDTGSPTSTSTPTLVP